MSLDTVRGDGRLLIALGDGGTVGDLPANLQRRALEGYEVDREAGVLEVLAMVNGGEFCLSFDTTARLRISDNGRVLLVDVRSVTFFTALGGPTEWLTVDWRGEVTAGSTESGETLERYVGQSDGLRDAAFAVASPYGLLDFSVSLEAVRP